MININDKLYSDFESVRRIAIVPLMLEVICKTTGMGFAAVARVTDNRWVACRVRDEINFGLAEGGELKVETTICDEIRDSKKAVVIDHVAENADFCNHHTPLMYGFQSYISFPIILKNGDFFGTLCAIDPKPAKLNNSETLGIFKIFTELLSFHLQSVDLVERTHLAMQMTDMELSFSQNENMQYRQISSHSMSEQMRKISTFSDLLMSESHANDITNVQAIATKINSITRELTEMFQHVTKFSGFTNDQVNFEKINLNSAVAEACKLLSAEIKNIDIEVENKYLPEIYGSEKQIIQLFFHLISYVIMFSKPGVNPSVKIYGNSNPRDRSSAPKGLSLPVEDYREINLEISRTGIDEFNLKNIFDIFVHLNDKEQSKKYGPGLAYSKKVIHNHKGFISASYIPENTTLVSILFPVHKGVNVN